MTTRTTANLNLRPEAGTGNTPILVIPNASIIPERLFVRRDETPVLDDDGSPLNYAYERTEDNIASLRVDLTRYPDPEEAADRLLMACDELAALLTEKGP